MRFSLNYFRFLAIWTLYKHSVTLIPHSDSIVRWKKSLFKHWIFTFAQSTKIYTTNHKIDMICSTKALLCLCYSISLVWHWMWTNAELFVHIRWKTGSCHQRHLRETLLFWKKTFQGFKTFFKARIFFGNISYAFWGGNKKVQIGRSQEMFASKICL